MKIIRYENTIINLAEVRNINSKQFEKNEVQIFFYFKNSENYECIRIKPSEVTEFINKCYDIMIREE